MATGGGVDPYEEMAALKREEVDFLSAVAKRAYQSVLRHGDPIYLKTRDLAEPLKKLYVASFAFQLPDPQRFSKELKAKGKLQWSPDPYKLVVFQEDGEGLGWEALPRTVERFIRKAKKKFESPHFILLNELSHGFEERAEMELRWAALAEKYGTYIVPGTFHCTREFFAVAPIYCPDSEKNHFALKQNAAIKQGERIRTPDARELVVYETDYGNLVLWICLDIYDPGLVLKFLNTTNRFTGNRQEKGKRGREIFLVLVPAYSKDSEDNIKNCVKTVSRFSKTAMVCANSYADSETPNRLESHGFCGGEPLKVVLREKFPIKKQKRTFCQAVLYEIDLEKLRQFQAQPYQDNGIFSSSFSAIINGGPYVLRDVAD